MRKQQISVLSSIPIEEPRLIKEAKGYSDELADIQTKISNEIESNNYKELEYHIFSLEQQKKYGDAAELLLETIPLKRKIAANKKAVIFIIDWQSRQRYMQYYTRLGNIFNKK